MVRIVGTNCVRLVYLICRLSWQSSVGSHLPLCMRSLARLVCASAGLALTCLGSRVGALHPPPHRFLLPAMIGGNDTTEFLRDVDDEVIFNGGAAAAGHDDSDPILEGLDECVDAFTPRFAGFRTMQPLSELDPDVEDDDDDSRDLSAGEDSERDDNDDDDDDDAALMSPFTGDAPAGPPLRGGEAPGTAAPALDSR